MWGDFKPHIFLTRANQNTLEIHRNFDGTLDNFGFMVFAASQEKKEFYTFKDVLLQQDKSYFVLSITKAVEAHESRSHWTLTKNSEFNNKHKNKDGLSI